MLKDIFYFFSCLSLSSAQLARRQKAKLLATDNLAAKGREKKCRDFKSLERFFPEIEYARASFIPDRLQMSSKHGTTTTA